MTRDLEVKRFGTLRSRETVENTMDAVRERGINCEFVENRGEALSRLKELIPAGAEVMTGASKTLQEIGFIDLLKSRDHPWKNLKDEILQEKDPSKQNELRKKSVLSDYWLGSVHAIAETGELVVASASGSQLPSYVYTSNNVIWVAGVQKIMPTLEDAIRRVREYVLPLEDKRMKEEGYPGSTIAKLLIFEGEAFSQRKLTLILVNEKLGF